MSQVHGLQSEDNSAYFVLSCSGSLILRKRNPLELTQGKGGRDLLGSSKARTPMQQGLKNGKLAGAKESVWSLS